MSNAEYDGAYQPGATGAQQAIHVDREDVTRLHSKELFKRGQGATSNAQLRGRCTLRSIWER
jgi:hypothetical protein